MRQRSSAHRHSHAQGSVESSAQSGRRLIHLGLAALLLLPAVALLALGAPVVRAATSGSRSHLGSPLNPAGSPSVPQGVTPSPFASATTQPSPTATSQPSPTATATAQPSPTATSQPSPTATGTLAPTATSAPTPTATPGQSTTGQQNSGLIVALVIALGVVLLGLAALVLVIGTRRPPSPPSGGGGYQEPYYTPPENYDPSRPSVYPGQGGGVSEIGPDDPTDPGLGAPPRR